MCESGFNLKFFGIAVLRNYLQLDSRNNLTTNRMFLNFFRRSRHRFINSSC